MKRLGIDGQTVFGLAPLEHIALAKKLGCGHISIALSQAPWKLPDVGEWSLREDARLRRDVVAASADSGVSLSLGEGFAIRPNVQVRDFAKDLDLMAEMGVRSVGTVGLGADVAQAKDQLAQLSELTAERGLILLLEFAPPHAFPGLLEAAAALCELGRANIKLNLDVMHFYRCGNTAGQLEALPRSLIGRAQLCDAKLLDQGKAYMEEACFERLLPGEGEIPLEEFLAALPQDLPIGIETPNRDAVPDKSHLLAHVRQAVEMSVQILRS